MPRLAHALSGRTTNRPPVITKLHSFVTYRATAAAIVQNVWQTTRPREIRMKEIGLPLLLLTALASPAFAADCQPNGIGGSFCINDDGTTTDTVPNEVNGMDTYSNNGGYTSSLPDRSGADEALEGSSLSTQQGVGSGQSDSALAGRDWHSPANLNDGAATSSMSLLDKP